MGKTRLSGKSVDCAIWLNFAQITASSIQKRYTIAALRENVNSGISSDRDIGVSRQTNLTSVDKLRHRQPLVASVYLKTAAVAVATNWAGRVAFLDLNWIRLVLAVQRTG